MRTGLQRIRSRLATIPRRELWLLLAAMALAAALVIAYVIATRPNGLAGDQKEYDRMAIFFTQGKPWWGLPPSGIAHASVFRPPAYPLWAGFWYELLGNSPTRLALVQSLLASVTVLLSWLLARRLFGPKPALAAAFVVAVFPLVWEWFGLLYTEALAIPLLMLAVLAFLERPVSRWGAVGIGALMGVNLLLRPSSLFLFAGLAASFVLAVGWRRGAGMTAISVFAAVLVILPWSVRNFIVSDAFIPLSVEDAAIQGTFNDVSANDPTYPYAWRLNTPAIREILDGPPISDADFHSELVDDGLDYIESHPLSVAKAFYWNGLTRLWDVRRPSHALDEVPFEGRSKAVTKIGLGMYYLLLPLAIFGLWRHRRRTELVVPLLVMALGASVVFTVASGTRYRAPLEPLIAIVAVAAFVRPTARGSGPSLTPTRSSPAA